MSKSSPPPHHAPALPPLAGICSPSDSQKVGLTVRESTACLRRIFFVKRKMAEIAACHLNSTPEWELKAALALHAWQDMQHADMLRERMLELRENEAGVNENPDVKLTGVLNEAIFSNTSAELTAAMLAIRTATLDAIASYLAAANPLADQPSCRILKLIRVEEEEMIGFCKAALNAMFTADQSSRGSVSAWAKDIRAYMAAAGGISGTEAKQEVALPKSRASCEFAFDPRPRRDSRFRGLYDTSIPADVVYADESRSMDERNLALLFKRVREMDVPETIASILAESTDEPWEYQLEMYRQMWDEARHALLGQAALEACGAEWTALPINVTFSYKLGKYLNARERHLLLYGIEQSLMPAKTGKRYEFEIAEASGDTLSRNFHDFDWADEVLHAAIGRRQLRRYFGADPSELLRRADELVKRIAEGIERDGMPEEAKTKDAQAPAGWWETFAEKTLGHPVPPVPETHVKDWKPLSS